jgi:hypothetical protein
MLVTNQRLDQLAAARTDFANRGMLSGTCLSEVLQVLGELSYNLMYKRATSYIYELRPALNVP